MTQWIKKGLILKPDPKLSWMQSHAMVPTPDHLQGSLYKIYFSGRNQHNQSSIGWAIFDLESPEQALEISRNPVLTPGRLGTFDDNGVLPSCIINHEGKKYLYYIGFKPGGTTRMDLFGGLAISEDQGQTFQRWSEAPILERTRANPLINTAPWVIAAPESGWLMYYVSGVEWVNKDLPRYNIQIARSDDLKNWQRDGQIAIDFGPAEDALARPYVVKDDSGYRMWFSAKTDHYRPYTATSPDGLIWTREKDPVLAPSAGADEEMVCYTIVIKHKNQQFMFYNGNGYGANGLCLAIS